MRIMSREPVKGSVLTFDTFGCVFHCLIPRAAAWMDHAHQGQPVKHYRSRIVLFLGCPLPFVKDAKIPATMTETAKRNAGVAHQGATSSGKTSAVPIFLLRGKALPCKSCKIPSMR